MPYDELLAIRLRATLSPLPELVESLKTWMKQEVAFARNLP